MATLAPPPAPVDMADHPWRSPLLTSDSELAPSLPATAVSTPLEPPTLCADAKDAFAALFPHFKRFVRAGSVDTPPVTASSRHSSPFFSPQQRPASDTMLTSPTSPASKHFLPRRASLPPPPPLSFAADRSPGTKRRRAPPPGTIDLASLFPSGGHYSTPGSGSTMRRSADEDLASSAAPLAVPARPPRPKPTPSLSGMNTPATGWFGASTLDPPAPACTSFLSVTPACAAPVPSPLPAGVPVPGAPRLGSGSGSGSSSGSTSTLVSPGGGFSPLPPTPGSAVVDPLAAAGGGDSYFSPRASCSSQNRWSTRAGRLSPWTATGVRAPRLGNGEGFSPLPRTPGQILLGSPTAHRPKLLKMWSSDVEVPSITASDESALTSPPEAEAEAEGERDAGDGWTRAEAVRKRILREWEHRRWEGDGFSSGENTRETTPDEEPASHSGRSIFGTPGALSIGSSASPASSYLTTPEPVAADSIKHGEAGTKLGIPSPTIARSPSSPLKSLSSPTQKLGSPLRPGLTRSVTSPSFGTSGPSSPTAVFASSPLACKVVSIDDSALTDEEDHAEEESSMTTRAKAPSMMRSISGGGASVSPLRRTVSRRSTFTASATIARRLAAQREAAAARRTQREDDGSGEEEEEDRKGEVVEAGDGLAQVAGESLQCGLFAPTALVTPGSSSSSSRVRKRGSGQRESPRSTVEGLKVVLGGCDLPDLPSHRGQASASSTDLALAPSSPFSTSSGGEVFTPPPLVPLPSASADLQFPASDSFNPYFPLMA